MATTIERVKGFFTESKRVLMVTKKPGMKEFKMAAKITGMGMLLIGTIGLIIRLVAQLVLGS